MPRESPKSVDSISITGSRDPEGPADPEARVTEILSRALGRAEGRKTGTGRLGAKIRTGHLGLFACPDAFPLLAPRSSRSPHSRTLSLMCARGLARARGWRLRKR